MLSSDAQKEMLAHLAEMVGCVWLAGSVGGKWAIGCCPLALFAADEGCQVELGHEGAIDEQLAWQGSQRWREECDECGMWGAEK